jgi:pyruvate ferredoxin oxidoreductase alpha subunit
MVMKVMSADHAVAHGARLARVEVIPAFPITPQTLIVELLSEFINDGELDADFMPVESEHSAMSAAIGASAGGVRTFTATSSQGLALMHEMLYAAPHNRLPVVMANVNRSLGAASGIWLEYNDSMPERESGWLQVYIEDNQEALDMIIQAYRIGEDRGVMLPIMVCLDGFVLSHTVERVDLPDQDLVDKFLPKFSPLDVLDSESPKTFNAITPPEYAMEMRYRLERAIEDSIAVIEDVDSEYGQMTGRRYGGLLDTYRMEDADIAMMTLGTATSTAKVVVDRLNEKGKKVGLIKLRFMRPFPGKELLEITKDLKGLGVFDRSISFNGFGPVFTETRNALHSAQFPITNHIAGLGGRDITFEEVKGMFDVVEKSARGESIKECNWHGLRGVTL